MDMVSKHRRGAEETLGISDRFTSLPVDLICRILAFLPTIDAVRTSVLSSKLRSVYASVPSIDVDDARFLGENKLSKCFFGVLKRLIAENTNDTIPFVHFSCNGSLYEHTDISSWILAVVRKNVENLHFALPMQSFYGLPRELYTCTSLVTLSLHGVVIPCFGKDVFSKLKTLLLYTCMIVNPDSACTVSNAAPFLEKLCLHGCYFLNLGEFQLSLPSLKSLCLRHPKYYSSKYLPYNIVLKTPNLHCLTLYNFLPKIQWEASPILLTKVRHHMSDSFDSFPDKKVEYGVRLAETLSGFCYLKKLTLSSCSQEVLLSSTVALPVLHSLTHLKLRKYDDEITWRLKTRISEFAPNVDVLDMEMVDSELIIYQNDDCFPKKRDRLRVRRSTC